MSQFHFRLATLLRLRESARDECRVLLAEAQRAYRDLQNRLASLAARQARLQDECRRAAGPGEVDVVRLVEAQQYAAVLWAEEAELEQQRLALAAEIDRRRQALVEADREVRTLEKLRENQFQTHRRDEVRQEGKRLDEAAIQAVGR
jgi:flagellar protein FliJ